MADDTRKKSKGLKWAALVVILLVAAIIAIPFVIDVNRFRPEIEARLSNALGREVKLGNMQLSILSGGIRIDDISIADNPAFNRSQFLVSKSFQAGIELKPLIFSREIRITGISVVRPEIILVRSSSGKWNFSDLGSTAGGSREAAGGDSGGLSGAAFSIRKLKITGGRITFINGNKERSVYEDVNLVVHDFSPSSSFPFTLTASLPGEGRLKLEGKAGPLNKTDTVLTPSAAELDVADLDLVASGFVAPDSGISGILNFKGTLTSDGRRAESKGKAEAGKLQLVRGGAPAGRPISMGYAVDYDLASQKGALSSGEIKSGQAVAHLSGNYSMSGEHLLLNLRLHGTDMPLQDLEALLPAFGVTLPSGASFQSGSLKVDLTSEGPIEKMVTTGTADISNARLAGFDMAGKMAALASIAGIRSSNVTDIETLASGLRVSPEGIDVRDILLIMPALGRLSGSGRVNNDQSLDFTMRAALKPSGALGAGLGRLVKSDTLNIPFFVRGTSSDPKFVLDAKNAAAGFLESQLGGQGSKETQTEPGKALGNMLDNLLKKEK